MNTFRRFSIAHYDKFHGEYAHTYYTILKNADQAFRDNIHDVYFGKYFYYTYNGEDKRCGNPMGVEASDEQIEYLFKIQNELGVEISLTVNTMEFPHEVVFNDEIRQQFVEWIGGFYDRGLRSCTISSTHIMRTGELQNRCPDMRWKSTVNQICADAQQFIDFAYLGYNTILLDRSLNRNIKELRQIKRAQDYLNEKNPRKKVLTSLLVAESCVYSCPFKREHDSVGEVISTDYFKGPANLTCNGWRGSEQFIKLPRSGINLVASSSDSYNKWLDLVDVLKVSGRLSTPMFDHSLIEHMKAVWFYSGNPKTKQTITFKGETIYADNFQDILDNNLEPIHDWIPGWIDTRHTKDDFRSTYKKYSGIWSTDGGKRLEKLLTSCKNQCWDCHECERTFGMEDIDSALQLRLKS
tara:strand:+ start:624 stop:1853 length:1230 start_codon:yes stop_codon:yes gene_type:complete